MEKLVANLHDKTEYVIHRRNLKQTLNHGLVFKKVHRVTKFNQNSQLSHIDIKTNLRKKKDFEKDFFKLLNNAVFRKTMEIREHMKMLNLSNRKKKKLFGFRTKLSYYKSFSEKRYEQQK